LDTIRKYSVTDSQVIGGTNAIDEKIFSLLPQPKRISGQNRFDTSASVIDKNIPDGKIFFVATGYNFPDALTGGVLAALNSSNIMLIPPTKSLLP
jgi:putative cell wall-binding protein